MGGLCVGVEGLDALVVGLPVDDALLDLLFGEAFFDGAEGEGGEFCVGGEAEADDLTHGERGEGEEVFRGEQQVVAQPLFAADDAVLQADRISADLEGEHQENYGDQDDPKAAVQVRVVVMRVPDAGDENGDEQDGEDEEVKEGIEAGVDFVVLRSGHGVPRCGRISNPGAAEMIARVRGCAQRFFGC